MKKKMVHALALTLACMSITSFHDVKSQRLQVEEQETDLEMGNAYFTATNTDIVVLNHASTTSFISNNQVFPAISTTSFSTAQTLCTALGFQNVVTQIPAQHRNKIIIGANQLYTNAADIKYESFYEINLSDSEAEQKIKTGLAKIVADYIDDAKRVAGYTIIFIVRHDKVDNQQMLYVTGIPSSYYFEKKGQKPTKTSITGKEEFEGKTGEVLQAMEMMEPFLGQIFLDGHSKETQRWRKNCWTCSKGTAAIIVILVIAAFAGISAITGLVTAIQGGGN